VAQFYSLGNLEIMPFTKTQKSQFIALLQTKGWQLRDGTIESAGGGLYFSDSHFGHWSPSQMHDIFTQRAARIAKAQIGDWKRSTRENQEASWAAEEVMNHD
jgi:hypothetical protein